MVNGQSHKIDLRIDENINLKKSEIIHMVRDDVYTVSMHRYAIHSLGFRYISDCNIIWLCTYLGVPTMLAMLHRGILKRKLTCWTVKANLAIDSSQKLLLWVCRHLWLAVLASSCYSYSLWRRLTICSIMSALKTYITSQMCCANGQHIGEQ